MGIFDFLKGRRGKWCTICDNLSDNLIKSGDSKICSTCHKKIKNGENTKTILDNIEKTKKRRIKKELKSIENFKRKKKKEDEDRKINNKKLIQSLSKRIIEVKDDPKSLMIHQVLIRDYISKISHTDIPLEDKKSLIHEFEKLIDFIQEFINSENITANSIDELKKKIVESTVNNNLKKRKLISDLTSEEHKSLNNKSYEGVLYNGIGYDLHKNGELSIEGEYKDGQQVGEWKTYYDNCQLDILGKYKDGKMNGKFKFYYKDGVLSRETNYKDGKEDGLNIQWYHNGEKEFEQNWKKGKLISQKRWDEDGNEIECENISSNISDVKSKNLTSKMTEEELDEILLQIDLTLTFNPFYQIVKKRGEIISSDPNIFTNTKLIIDEWVSGHVQDYQERNDSKEDSIFKYNNYLEIYNTINKYLQSNNVNEYDSNKLKELVFLRISSCSSLEGVKKYLFLYHEVSEVDLNNLNK